MKKLKITDNEAVRNGADYTFVCGKIPFAITCSKILPHGENNLIDLDLINKMKIPLLNIRVRRIQILGQECRSVGTIDQTIHCVSEGKLQGTIHLSATVVRRRGRVLAHGFPLTEFGGFHGPSSANSKLFHGSEFQLVKDRGNNKNSSSIV